MWRIWFASFRASVFRGMPSKSSMDTKSGSHKSTARSLKSQGPSLHEFIRFHEFPELPNEPNISSLFFRSMDVYGYSECSSMIFSARGISFQWLAMLALNGLDIWKESSRRSKNNAKKWKKYLQNTRTGLQGTDSLLLLLAPSIHPTWLDAVLFALRCRQWGHFLAVLALPLAGSHPCTWCMESWWHWLYRNSSCIGSQTA